MSTFFGILSFVLSFGATIPYAVDIVQVRARPARSTRILFLFLMIVMLFVQSQEFSSWVLLLTVGEVASQLLLFGLSFRYGMGGLGRLDIICYGAFIVGLAAYLFTRNAAFSLTLLILTDLMAFVPTIVKNWRQPTSDTWVFFVVGGVGAAAASLLARSSNGYPEIVFPAYILVANALAVAPILLHKRRVKHGMVGVEDIVR